MSRLLALLLLLALTAEAQAQGPGAFARIGFGARGVAMGNGLSADVFGAASPFYNPALAPLATAQHLDAAAGFLSLDRELQHAQFAFPLPPRAGAAIGIIRAGISNIDGRNSAGFHTGELSAEESMVFTAFGVRLSGRVAGGFGLRFYRVDLLEGVDAPITIGLSAGLTARLSERLALGFAVDDLLASYRWDTSTRGGGQTTDPLPVRTRLGAAYSVGGGRGVLTAEVEGRTRQADLRRPFTRETGGEPQPGLETERRTYGTVVVRGGGELWLAEPFALRAGVDRIGQDGFGGASPSAGFAVRQQLGEIGARLDYTALLEPYGLGIVHLVALRLDL